MAAPNSLVDMSLMPALESTGSKEPTHRLPTVSASQALQNLASGPPLVIGTGVASIDRLLAGPTSILDGGFERGKTTELWGPVGAGKTAIVLHSTAKQLKHGHRVMWLDCATPLNIARLRSILQTDTEKGDSDFDEAMSLFSHYIVPTLAHLLALILHAPAGFPAKGTSMLVIDGLNTLFDIEYPRILFTGASKTEQQKWQAGRRYAALGAVVAGLNKLAVMSNMAVVVSTGCTSRTRSDSGLGSALVPGVGGAEWDGGIWTRLVAFRDFAGRFVGLQKCAGRSLISREEIGHVGHVVGFVIRSDGSLDELNLGDGPMPSVPQYTKSPVKARKRNFEEVADSDEEVDEYGWTELDDDALAAEGVDEEPADASTTEN